MARMGGEGQKHLATWRLSELAIAEWRKPHGENSNVEARLPRRSPTGEGGKSARRGVARSGRRRETSWN